MKQNQDRYLSLNNGYYVMKIITYRDPLLNGERVKLYLRTKDVQEARKKRDLVLKAYLSAGIIHEAQANLEWKRNYAS